MTLTSDEEESDDEQSFEEAENEDNMTLTSDEETSGDEQYLQEIENEDYMTLTSDGRENDDDRSSQESEDEEDIDEDSDISSRRNLILVRPHTKFKERSLNFESSSDVQQLKSEMKRDETLLSNDQRDIESMTIFTKLSNY